MNDEQIDALLTLPERPVDRKAGDWTVPEAEAIRAHTRTAVRAALAQQAALEAPAGEAVALTGPEFLQWAAQWFGPYSDEDYLAKAVRALPGVVTHGPHAAPAPAADRAALVMTRDELITAAESVGMRWPMPAGVDAALRRFLDAAGGEGLILGDIDAGELFFMVYPESSAAAPSAQPVDARDSEDAARLDWLDAHSSCAITEEDGQWFVGNVFEGDAQGPYIHLREAIDAARATGKDGAQ